MLSNSERRYDEERKLMETNNDMSSKLDRIWCKNGAFINDKKFKYFLITNDVCKESCCNMNDHSDFDWAKAIEWQAVFDFYHNTFENGLGKHFMNSKDVLIQPRFVTGNKIITIFKHLCFFSVLSC